MRMLGEVEDKHKVALWINFKKEVKRRK